MYVWLFLIFMIQCFRSDDMLKRKKMFNYDKLLIELNEYVPYILQCFKRRYGTYLSDAKMLRLNLLIDSKEDLVVIDGEEDRNKIHINPINEMFINRKYDYIKEYHLINVVIPTILKMFITTSISKSEFQAIKEPSLQQEFSFYLNNGFSSFILEDFLQECRLDNKKIPKKINKDSLEFVLKIEKLFSEKRDFMNLIFYYDYITCMEKVYEQTGIDLLEVYENHLEERNNLKISVEKILSKTNMNKESIEKLMEVFSDFSSKEFLEKLKKEIKNLYCNDKILQKEYLEELKKLNKVDLTLVMINDENK